VGPDIASGRVVADLVALPPLEALAPVWKDLESRAHASFFLGWTWIGTWLECLPATVHPRLLRVERDGRVIGLAVVVSRVVLRHRVLRVRTLFLNCTGDPALDEITIEHNGFLAEAGAESVVAMAALALLRRRMDEWDEIVFECVGAPDDVVALEVAPARWRERSRGPSHYVDLEALRAKGKPFADGLGRRSRYQLKRSMREYELAGPLTIEEAADVPTAKRFLEGLVALHQQHWRDRGKPGAFANPFFAGFHQRLVSRGLPEGLIQLLRVSAGGTDLGYIYNHAYRGHVCVYQTGLNYTTNGPYDRPGVVSHVLAIEHNLRKGHSIYDFCAGDAEYKRVLSSSAADLATLILQAPRMKLRLEDQVRSLRQRVRSKDPAQARPAPAEQDEA
jgi:CelD/BcsL family acetyltransferase involved in cellulose biosynthesis